MTEAELLQAIRDLARMYGWLTYHTHTSTRSEPGFPDMVITRGGRLLFFELKSAKGKVTPAQEQWLSWLGACPGVVAYRIRPDDLQRVADILSGKVWPA